MRPAEFNGHMAVVSPTFKNQEHRVWGKAKAIPRYCDLLREKSMLLIWAQWQICWAEQRAKSLGDHDRFK